MQRGQESGPGPDHPRSAGERLEHRRPVHPVHDEVRPVGVMDLRYGIVVPPEVPHDRRFPVGRCTAAVAAQDPTAADVVDVRGTARPDEGTGIVAGRWRAIGGHARNSTLRAPDPDG